MSSAGNISASAASVFFDGQKSAGAGKAPGSGDGAAFGLHLIRSVEAHAEGTGNPELDKRVLSGLRGNILDIVRNYIEADQLEEGTPSDGVELALQWKEVSGNYHLTIVQLQPGEKAVESPGAEGDDGSLFVPFSSPEDAFQRYLEEVDFPPLADAQDSPALASEVSGSLGSENAGVFSGEALANEGTDLQPADAELSDETRTPEFGLTGTLQAEAVEAATSASTQGNGAPGGIPAATETDLPATGAGVSKSAGAAATDSPPEGRLASAGTSGNSGEERAVAEPVAGKVEKAAKSGATDGVETATTQSRDIDPAIDTEVPASAKAGENAGDAAERAKDGPSLQAVSAEGQTRHRATAVTARSETSTERAADGRPLSSLVDPSHADEAFEGQSRYARPFADAASSGTENVESKSPAPGEAAGGNAATGRALRSGVSAAALTFAAALKGEGASGEPEFSLSGLQQNGAVPLDISVSDTGTAAARAAAQVAQSPTQSAHLASQVAVEIARHATQGTNRFQIRLDPPELGRVDVRLKIQSDGSVQAHLTVERSETLDLFLRDQRGLERALDAAGLKVENSSLQFSLRDQGASPGFAGHDPSGNDGRGDNGNGARQDGGEGEGELPDGAQIRRAYVSVSTGAVDIQV